MHRGAARVDSREGVGRIRVARNRALRRKIPLFSFESRVETRSCNPETLNGADEITAHGECFHENCTLMLPFHMVNVVIVELP